MSDKRSIAIDYGLARIGMSVSDPSKMIASPWKTVTAEKKIAATALLIANEIKEIEKEKGCSVDAIIIGKPIHMDGRPSVLSDEVELFAEELKKQVTANIILWDERLTSVQAEKTLRETKMTRKKRSKSVDVVAAVIILQTYLDTQSFDW